MTPGLWLLELLCALILVGCLIDGFRHHRRVVTNRRRRTVIQRHPAPYDFTREDAA